MCSGWCVCDEDKIREISAQKKTKKDVWSEKNKVDNKQQQLSGDIVLLAQTDRFFFRKIMGKNAQDGRDKNVFCEWVSSPLG